MKQIYVVTNGAYSPSVAFEDKERAEAVRSMCGGDIEEVPLIDASPSAADVLGAVTEALDLMGEMGDDDEGDGGDGGDGGAE